MDRANRKMSIAFLSKNGMGLQAAWGIYNFTWPEGDSAKLKVRKQTYDGNSTVNPSGVDIALYNDNTCTTEIKRGTTDGNGSLSFENLGAGNYRVKQTTTRTGLKVAEDQTFRVLDNEATDQHADLSFTNVKESKIFSIDSNKMSSSISNSSTSSKSNT